MDTYTCNCDSTLFFDNTQCLACGSELGFCPACRGIVPLVPNPDGAYTCGNARCRAALVKCFNYVQHGVCNRMVAAGGGPGQLCDCCRFNATIPDLSVPGNQQKWYRLEAAKRRLFYELDQLGLPYGTAADGADPPLSFDFKADVIPKTNFWRNIDQEEQVFTGHAAGRITINIREADDVQREMLRVDMGEAQRTLIGHFRHEIGHYYWDLLVKGIRENEFVAAFGNHNQPSYADALENYYAAGPPPDWATRHVSAYASMHPWEDFAETWATYLDMISALDTASNMGFGPGGKLPSARVDQMIRRYQRLGVALNEVNRSMGLVDVVPEVIVPPVADKLRFIHDLVRQAAAQDRPPQTATSPASGS